MEDSHNSAFGQPALVDEPTIQQMILDTNADVIPMLIDHFLEESESRLTKIYQAIQQKDEQTLEFETHTLGSAALALGAHALGECARRMEALCLKKQFNDAYDLESHLKLIADESLKALVERKSHGF